MRKEDANIEKPAPDPEAVVPTPETAETPKPAPEIPEGERGF